ncbi:hypothetical protein [Singulisphaera acidiphila]|uniref:Uncharacterized protein n=1 Tax=Singulisphaera acidiphila (strain ATCC BAA-1392 / DSM 18658 / VKM B-2454 / MOB10) TaxID=886293 RepID=L0D9B0_SINAD|nr:hypothetical protein [Singulisphaera acidiphila]AGA25445.1 hypothetical protein Sinac_1046 [Singulisphaera acidiphila DSM 18658]
MPTLIPLLALLAFADEPVSPTVSFEAPKYGVKASIPKDWPIAAREEEDRVFVALIPQDDPERPGVVACELGLAPENLDEYRTRIDGNAKRAGPAGRKLARNEVVKDPKRDRLETIWEFRPSSGGLWRELSVRILANRQMYTLTLNVDDATYATARPLFDALVASIELSAPNTGADLLDKATNRWVQREFKFAIDLPEAWRPVLAPSEVALFFANGPATGIWSDNALVLAQPHGPLDLQTLVKEVPDQLRKVEPNCEVLSCEVIKQGKLDALETVVRTQRGPFSMTILERRFRGGRFDYEVKYTLESKRFDALAPALRKSLDSFGEVPGSVPAAADKSS